MKTQSSRRSRTFFALGIGAALSVLGSAEAPGREKCKMSWELPAANSTYTGQHAFDVGDLPGHQVRIFGVRRSFGDGQPNCEGLQRWSSRCAATRTTSI